MGRSNGKPIVPARAQHAQAAKPSNNSYLKWLESYPQVSKWMSKYNVRNSLKENKGLVKFSNFLPEFVAEGLLKSLESIPDEQWNITEAREDYTQNNISHSFWSTKFTTNVEKVARVISLLLPESYHSFSAARYCKNDHIAPHDDRAYTQVMTDEGGILMCSRDVAIIYYLTKDWQASFGGSLVDVEGGATYVPEFNSAIVFEVPRYHEVTPMTTTRSRYSIFGWFLCPGKKYELFLGDDKGKQTAGSNESGSGHGQGGTEKAVNNKKKKRAMAVDGVDGGGGDGDGDSKQAQRLQIDKVAKKRKKKRMRAEIGGGGVGGGSASGRSRECGKPEDVADVDDEGTNMLAAKRSKISNALAVVTHPGKKLKKVPPPLGTALEADVLAGTSGSGDAEGQGQKHGGEKKSVKKKSRMRMQQGGRHAVQGPLDLAPSRLKTKKKKLEVDSCG